MTARHPGVDGPRLAWLMKASVERCRLDLSGAILLTEAASGAYVVTPILAALAGASTVYALAKPTRHGTVEDIRHQTMELAEYLGVGRQVHIITRRDADIVARADIITNSGHVRPLDAAVVESMKPGAVIPLMYEAWEFRAGDLDCHACRRRGIPVGGTNERHPAVDVFSFLGMLAVKLLLDAGVAVHGNSILLLCDNPFVAYIEHGLRAAGARVDVNRSPSAVATETEYDAVLVALTPRGEAILTRADLTPLSPRWDHAVIAQFWGDIDRPGLLAAGRAVWPPDAPEPGHMGILLSAIGPEPIVRLQTGGLKVGEVMWRARAQETSLTRIDQTLQDSGFGMLLPEVIAGS